MRSGLPVIQRFPHGEPNGIPYERHVESGGINNRNQFVGFFETSLNDDRAYLATLTTGSNPSISYVPFDYPGAVDTWAAGINDFGVIVGSYSDGTSQHGFVEDNTAILCT